MGIIGGADGPTAVFVTVGDPFALAAVLILAAALTAAGIWWFRHRRRR